MSHPGAGPGTGCDGTHPSFRGPGEPRLEAREAAIGTGRPIVRSPSMTPTLRLRLATAVLSVLLAPLAAARPSPLAPALQPQAQQPATPEVEFPLAPVEIDGRELFRVRGVSAYPAETRAALIAQRLGDLAADPEVDPSKLVTLEEPACTWIKTEDGRVVMGLVDADAEVEGLAGQRSTLVMVVRDRIAAAMNEYRAARTPEALWSATRAAGLALLLLAVGIALLTFGMRRLQVFLERRYQHRREGLGIQSFEIVRAERIWLAVRTTLRVVQWGGTFLLAFFFLRSALERFPWTYGISQELGSWVVVPLLTIARSALAEIPNLIFLGVLYLVIRWVLKLLLLFFRAVEGGRVKLEGFDPTWALPTYRLTRIGVIAFSLVVAYPYIPGSHSDAFKGVSLFLGVLVSLGSSSAISNIIAGYMLIYRGAFKLGDRVRIGDVTGEVSRIRLQVTHVRTTKNEEVTIPNSSILGSHVVNYSALAREDGLILHLSVGIGYETPWRQVEAMLLLAAERTPDLKREPAPFVRQLELGDFAVTYELNAYSDTPHAMPALLSAMSRSIQDVFNEYGVQIMTPNYEADPAAAKVVPKDQWYAAPARPEGSGGEAPARPGN